MAAKATQAVQGGTDAAARTRARILEASYEVFAERGYHTAKISDIADRIHMSHGTFYRYFKNKLDIFSTVIGGVMTDLLGVFAEEKPDAPDTLDEYRAQLLRIGRKLFTLMMDDPQFSRILFYESLGIDEEINDTIHRGFDLFGALTAAYLRNGVDKGFLRKDLVIEETAFALNAVLLEGARRISLSEEPEKAFEKWTKALVDLMLDGMADRGTTS
jgi:AcrR family transcriptional regulator